MKRAVTYISGLLLSVCLYAIFSVDSYAYTVQSGDTLGKIAADNGMTVEELLSYNDISNPNLIYPGQEINLGKNDDTTPYKRVNLTNDEKQLIKTLFDADYYKNENPDVVAAYGEDPDKLFEHFLDYGLWETRQPNADFNVNAYASAYDDVKAAYKNENLGEMVKNIIIHYAVYGKEEGRTTTTIDECLSEGIVVLYYGAYDDSTAPTAPEHIVAEFPKEPSGESEEPSAHGPIVHNFKDVFYVDVWQELSTVANILYRYGFDNVGGDVGTYIEELDDLETKEVLELAYTFASYGRQHSMSDYEAAKWLEVAFQNFGAMEVFEHFNPEAGTQIDEWCGEYEYAYAAAEGKLYDYMMRASEGEFDDMNLLMEKMVEEELGYDDIVEIVGYCGAFFFSNN